MCGLGVVFGEEICVVCGVTIVMGAKEISSSSHVYVESR